MWCSPANDKISILLILHTLTALSHGIHTAPHLSHTCSLLVESKLNLRPNDIKSSKTILCRPTPICTVNEKLNIDRLRAFHRERTFFLFFFKLVRNYYWTVASSWHWVIGSCFLCLKSFYISSFLALKNTFFLFLHVIYKLYISENSSKAND